MTWLAEVASGLELIAKGLRKRDRELGAPRPAERIEALAGNGHANGSEASPEYLSAPAAAEMTGLALGTLSNMRSAGGGPPFRQVGRRVIYRRSELIDWMESHRQETAQEEAPAS